MKKTELARLINPEHPLVKLAQTIDWQNFDEHFGISYSTETGRPGISTRLMVALHYLKATPTTSPTRPYSGAGWRTLTGNTSRG